EGHTLDEVLADIKRIRAAEAVTTPNVLSQCGLAAPLARSEPGSNQIALGLWTGQFAADLRSATTYRQRHATLESTVALGGWEPIADAALSPRPRYPQDPTGRPARPTACLVESRHTYFRSVARIGLEVAEALAYAHGQGV